MTHAAMFGAAMWLSHPDGDVPSLLTRCAFTVKKPVSARLTVVGLGVGESYLNGRAVTEDRFLPLTSDYCPRSFQLHGRDFGEITGHRLYCPQYDVTHLLREGENVLAVLTGEGWFAGKMDHAYGIQRVCFSLSLTEADGSVRHIVSTPDTVRVKRGFVVGGSFTRGETHDYRGYDERFMLPGYDDSDWARPAVLPPLETEYRTTDCPSDRVIRRLKPIPLGEVAEGTLWSAGGNITGTPRLICRAPAGEEITVRFYEALTSDGQPDRERHHGQVLRFISDGTPRVLYARFTWLAFCYFTVSGPAEVEAIDVIHTAIARTACFSCDDPVLHWLSAAYMTTQLDNMHMGIPSDCPHLERRGYTGDGQLCCEAAMTMLDAQSFYRKWIGDISDCQDRLTGHVQYTAPYTHSGGGPGGWGCAIVEVPYRYWRHYGDASLLPALYPQMLRYFDYLDAHSEGELVVSDRVDEWCLGDWCTPEEVAIPAPFVNTYFYIRSIDRVIEIAPIVGREGDIPALRAKRETLVRAMLENYYDRESGDFCGNVQGANAFALDIGLGDGRTRRTVVEHYRTIGCYDTGIFGTEIVTRMLFAMGEADVAYTLLSSHTENGSFGYMKDLGATTLFEYWGPYARSYNHPMFGAAAVSLYRDLLGIRHADGDCGWRRVVIRPALPSAMQSASGYITVPAGRIEVSLSRTERGVRCAVTLPDGVSATLEKDGVTHPLGAGVSVIE